jgi:SAM-dependent methyltransferase
MDERDHDDAVRASFERQTHLFEGDEAPFARPPSSAGGWLAPLDPGMILLDVACGAGHAAEEVAPHVRRVVGVDLTPALVRIGVERLAASGITNVALQEGTAAALPFVDASFDLVFCRGSLHHFADTTRALAEMARVCRAGGRVVVSDMVAPSPEVREQFDALHRAIDPSHVRTFSEAELADLLGAAVGPVLRREGTDAFTLPVELMFNDGSDRVRASAALHAELDGGRPTGFEPSIDDGRVSVSFSSCVVDAIRRPDLDRT